MMMEYKNSDKGRKGGESQLKYVGVLTATVS